MWDLLMPYTPITVSVHQAHLIADYLGYTVCGGFWDTFNDISRVNLAYSDTFTGTLYIDNKGQCVYLLSSQNNRKETYQTAVTSTARYVRTHAILCNFVGD